MLAGAYFISKKFTDIVVLIELGVFIVLYIQGNFLSKNLPVLDGSTINWGSYSKENIIIAGICLVLEAALILAAIKLTPGKIVIYGAGLSIALFVMLTVSLVTTAVKNDIFVSKNNFFCTAENLNGASSDKNLFIFMVDTQGREEFVQAVSENERLAQAFDGFTCYTDALGIYPYTLNMVPYVLTGYPNLNMEQRYGDYALQAYNDSVLFKELDKRNYDIYLFSRDVVWYGEKNFNIKNNPGVSSATVKFKAFLKEELRYVWFKYMPYAFKQVSHIEWFDFGKCIEKYNWDNAVLYNEFLNNDINKTSNAQFRFLHAEGSHIPWDMDETMTRAEGKTYLQKSAAATLISAFIERLREDDVYDNSVIIVMADHGRHSESSRYNPILLIKGVGEKHELVYSDKPVSFFDLQQAYVDLLDGKQSSELFPDVEYPRTRTIIWYEGYEKDYHMAEYQTDGRATDWDRFHETGNVYDK